MIAHLASHLGGGANLAGMRLHTALRRIGVDSTFYYGAGNPPDASYERIFENNSFFWRNLSALAVSWRNRGCVPGGFITSPGWIRRTTAKALISIPNIVQLHWVPRWLDLPSFLGSLPPGVPIVWTLHDLIPVTGGCHYPMTCDGFTKKCGYCPQLKSRGMRDATARFFEIKRKCYQKRTVHLVANSEWTRIQAQRSGLRSSIASLRTIHYGLDVRAFRAIEKGVAKAALGLPEGKLVVGFSCLDFSERRKGAELLSQALTRLGRRDVILLVLGSGQWSAGSGVEVVSVGPMTSPRLQSIFYSAADLFAMPSLVETFGNVAIEAMACGTPVVAYRAGGLMDVLEDRETGLLIDPVGDWIALSEGLKRLIEEPARRVAMGMAGRRRVEKCFTDDLMAQRYMELYAEISNGVVRA